MPLVPSDYPQRLVDRGIAVQVFGDWTSAGGSADHAAVVLHHTASGSSTKPADDAAYCQHGTSDAPLYNVMIDRTGVAWVLARNKSNSSGKISGTALNEALRGQANLTPAGQRGLGDTTSANAQLFAISAQNNGTGEPWSDALVHSMAVAADVALECLGLSHAGYVTTHRALTARKIDPCGPGCPDDWHAVITALDARGPTEVPDMWSIERSVVAGTASEPGDLIIGLPVQRKSARVSMFVSGDGDGASLWASQSGTGAIGLWDNGNQWELWLPNNYPIDSPISPDAQQVRVQNRGTAGPVSVTVYGE